MLPGASGSRWMPRKMAGRAIRTIDPSSTAMKVAAVVLASATHLYLASTPSAPSAGACSAGTGGGSVPVVWPAIKGGRPGARSAAPPP